MVLDNTVTGCFQGLHAGGGQERAIWARNYSVGNTIGFYFCWYNRNGVYARQTLDWIYGYAWPWDCFDIVALNDCQQRTAIEAHFLGVVYGNRFAEFTFGKKQPEPVHVDAYGFVVADNEMRAFHRGNLSGDSAVSHMVLANNRPLGKTVEFAPIEFADSVYAAKTDLPGLPSGMTIGCGRTTAVSPPNLPEPVLDGRTYYDPKSPDCGFQKALDRLAKTGGTLRLPGGRYPLKRALKIPSNVTLIGYGTGTTLCAASNKTSLIKVDRAANVAIRDFSVVSEYRPEATRPPAIELNQATSSSCVAIDIRGWEGGGISVTGGDVTIADCRAFGCGGAGFSADRCHLTMRTCIARDCATGFDVRRFSAASSLFGLIAGMNWRNGFRLRECANLSINSCNASRNGAAGFQLEACRGAAMLACVAMQNSLSEPGRFAGVQLADHCRQNTIGYSLLADIQGLPAPRNLAVKADATSGENVIRYNVIGDPQRPETAQTSPAIDVGEGAAYVGDNVPR